ncbi:acylphosphatase [Halalkalibacterium halodurans]|uniref:acylphosphatase n=1 Tax=Halalkalibacterium halodurans TaxID=86665 RepID=UPI002E250F81|nr:acylphosphatase [Halalkalibacterium halodurans]
MKQNLEHSTDIAKRIVRGVRGFNLCAYLVALEGWRRGLTLKWYYNTPSNAELKAIGFNPIGKMFSLSSDERTHFFFRSRGDKVHNEAVDMGTNKEQTKKYLEKEGVPCPEGKRFKEEVADEEIIQYARKLGYPLVIKPTFGSLGKGVVTNINTDEGFKKNLRYVRSTLNYLDVIIERFISGEDARVYVVQDKVVAALKRVPANVTGDGKSTIEELIQKKNEERKKNPHLATRLIKVDEEVHTFLRKEGYSLSSVLKKEELIYLRGKSNISSGGDSIDITDQLPAEIKEVAVKAVSSVPGLVHAGVDLIIKGNKAVVMEINPTAVIASHLFPMTGIPRNVPKAIVDYYFPETKETIKNNFYFDYKVINNLMSSREVNEIEITNAPIGQIHTKRYIVTGKVQGVGYRRWVRKRALLHNIHGYTKNLDNGKVVIVAASSNKSDLDEFLKSCYIGPDKANVARIKEYEWYNPIKVGFEIRSKSKEEEIKELKLELNQIKREKQEMEQEMSYIVKKYSDMKGKYEAIRNSSSWKVTAPLRKLMSLIKN